MITSSLFVASYVALFWYFMCISKNCRHRTDKYNIIIASAISSLAILFEPSKRRTELALYLFPRFLESIWMYLKRNNYVKPIVNGEIIIIAISLGIIMSCYKMDEKLDSRYLNIFKKFLGTK